MIFQVALAILDANRSKLLSVDDDGEAMIILSEYLDNITNKEYDSPFKSAASSIRGTSVGGVSNGCVGVGDGGSSGCGSVGDTDDGDDEHDGDGGDDDDNDDDDGGGEEMAMTYHKMFYCSRLHLWMSHNLSWYLIASLGLLLQNKLNE